MSYKEIDWDAMREANAENLITIRQLNTKAGILKGGSNWSPRLLKENLSTWEYFFMLASGFDAVSNNGGLVHGLLCYFDDDEGSDLHVPVEDMLACWTAIGCEIPIKAHEIGQRELKRLGVTKYGELTPEQEEEVEEIFDEALENDGEPFDIQLAAYARKHQVGES